MKHQPRDLKTSTIDMNTRGYGVCVREAVIQRRTKKKIAFQQLKQTY